MEAFQGLLISLGGMIMVGWVSYVTVDAFRQWYKHRVMGQLQTKLLDKITSVNELGAFLNTEAGARFLKGLTTEPAGPQTRILGATQSGIVLGVLGFALFIWNWFSPTISSDAKRAVYAVATITLALGVGSLVAAATSYRLSKRMGLLNTDDTRAVSDRSRSAV